MISIALQQHTAVTTQSDISGQGSAHGPQHIRILRTNDGTLYGQYLTASPNPRPVGDSDDYHKHTHVLRSTDNGATWTEIGTFESGYTSGELFTLSNGKIYVLCTPNGQPSLWDSVSNTVQPIPGNFQTHWPSGSLNVSPYNALGVSPDGSYAIFSRSRVNADTTAPNKPCTYEFQRINADGSFGTLWTATVPEGRYTYGHIYFAADGTLRWFGYYDVLPIEGGYTAASNQVGYLFTDPSVLIFDPVAHTFVGAHVIYHATPNSDGSTPSAQLVDVLPLADGSYLVAYTGRDGGHNSSYFNEIARVNADGSVAWHANGPFAYGGFYRFAPLSDGSALVVNCVPVGAADANQDPLLQAARLDPASGSFDTAQEVRLPGVAMNWNPGPANEFTLTRRGGSVPPADTVVLWFESTGGGGEALHFLRFAVTGVNSTPVDPCADLRAQLAAAQASVTALSAQLATANSQLIGLQGQLTTANSSLAAAQGNVSTLTAQNAALTAQVANLTAQNADLATQLATLQGQSVTQLIATNAVLVGQLAAKTGALHAIAQAVNAANVLP